MERAEPWHALGAAFADQPADAVLHLARRLVGEGDREDLRGPGAAAREDVGDARRQHPRLAGAGAGEHQQRSVDMLDRLLLLGVEFFEPRLGPARRAHARRPRLGAAQAESAGSGRRAISVMWSIRSEMEQ